MLLSSLARRDRERGRQLAGMRSNCNCLRIRDVDGTSGCPSCFVLCVDCCAELFGVGVGGRTVRPKIYQTFLDKAGLNFGIGGGAMWQRW